MNSTVQEILKRHATSKVQATEGHCSPGQLEFLVEFLKAHPEVKTVFEIGFNAGHSSLAFLMSRPDIQVVSLDLGAHDYVIKAKTWLDTEFPGRHLLLIGDSVKTMPRIVKDKLVSPDLIFLDGGHDAPIPEADLKTCLELARPDTWIIVDDVCPHMKDVVAAVQKAQREFKFAVFQVAKTNEYNAWAIGKKIA
jgi:predicted O-methyltransferase YrrM